MTVELLSLRLWEKYGQSYFGSRSCYMDRAEYFSLQQIELLLSHDGVDRDLFTGVLLYTCSAPDQEYSSDLSIPLGYNIV